MKLQDAETFFTAAVALRPRFASAHHLARHRLSVTGQVEPGDRLLIARRSACNPDDATVYNSLGNVYVNQSKPDRGHRRLSRGDPLKPGYDLPYGNLLAVLGNQGKFDEAVATCREAIKLAPEVHSVRVFLGDFLQMQGFLDEAVAAYEDAKRHDARQPPASRSPR